MYLRERRVCLFCGAYYDQKRLEKGFKKFVYRQSYLQDLTCKNCGSDDIGLEIEVVSEHAEKSDSEL